MTDIEELRALADELYENGDILAAIEHYKQCLKINPKDALLYNRIGFLYGKANEYVYIDEQIKYFKKALKLRPNYSGAIRNLALTYPKIDKYEESTKYFHKLFKLDAMPDDYFVYACMKIKLGDFEEGWKYYNYRFLKTYGFTYYPEIDKPEWDGQKITDKTLLVHCEQGFGDSIQFFRYLEQVKPLVGKIIFRVQKELVDLMDFNSKDIEVVSIFKPLEELSFDYHVPIMSLLSLLDAKIENIPLTQGYIKANPDKIEDYKQKFFNNDCFKIGITWNGSGTGNLLRNVPLRKFYPLTGLKNVKIYSFQKGVGAKQLAELPPDVEIIDMGQTFDNFSDTAAAMANLDLFITSDNSVFNLAASMGLKTFLLLNKDSEWRWFLDEETTPWYDSVRIFKKQKESDDWSLLMQKVVKNLSWAS